MTKYTYLMEELLPHRTNDGKRKVNFYWNAASQTWSVTCEGLPVPSALATELIAAAEAKGMLAPESDPDLDLDYERD